jgi:hypoxanthine phosphoribosyltransferase
LRVLLNAEEIAARVNRLAEGFAAHVDDGWTVVALLQGAIPFAADLMRAIEKRGRHPIYDSLWLESYRDARESSGKVVVRADL